MTRGMGAWGVVMALGLAACGGEARETGDATSTTAGKGKLRFRVVNPFATRARVTFEVVLPRALRTTGYWGFFSNEGAHSFELAPHESREVVLSVSDA